MKKRKQPLSEGTVDTSTAPTKLRKLELTVKDKSQGNGSGTSESAPFKIILSGVNADKGKADAGQCMIPGFLLKKGKDDSDPQSDLSDVYVIWNLGI